MLIEKQTLTKFITEDNKEHLSLKRAILHGYLVRFQSNFEQFAATEDFSTDAVMRCMLHHRDKIRKFYEILETPDKYYTNGVSGHDKFVVNEKGDVNAAD